MLNNDAMAQLWFSFVLLILFLCPLPITTFQLGNFAGIALIIFSATVTNTGKHRAFFVWDFRRD